MPELNSSKPLDKSDSNNTDNTKILSTITLSRDKKTNENTKLKHEHNMKKLKKLKKMKQLKKARKITIKKYCSNYRHNSFGKQDKSLYEACKKNQYCRQTKCKNIDTKFEKIKHSKLGANENTLLMSSITSACPIEMSNIYRKKCLNKATKKFYEDNGLGDIYSQVLECDKKTCSRERHIFLSNLFRANKTKKRLRQLIPVNPEDIPDQQIIETN